MIGTGIGLGLAGYRLNPPGVLPVLDLRFATDKSLTAFAGPTPSSSRASSGTYFDANGVLQSAGVNAARFNHVFNGTSWVSRGLLVEEQRTNLALYSEQIDHTAWLKFDSNVTANLSTAPDGTTAADKVIPNTVSANHGVYNSSAISISSGTQYTVSVYAKASGYNFLYLVCNVRGSSASTGVCVNLTDGTQSNGGASGTYTVTNVGDGWWRIACTATASSTSGYIEIWPRSTAGGASSTIGNGTDGVLVWGVQLEAGAFATSYIPTTSASVTRSADVCQITGSDFSGFWNGTEGSTVVEFDCPNVGTRIQYQANSVSSTNIDSAVSVGSTQYYEVYLPPHSALINGGSLANNLPTKVANGYKINDFAISMNGAAAVTDTSGVVSSPTRIFFGSDGTSGYLNGHIARLRYYQTRLENGTLRVLST